MEYSAAPETRILSILLLYLRLSHGSLLLSSRHAVGETEELVKEVEGKVWNAVLDMAEAMTYETKVPVVNIYNREDGKTVLRYLAERPVISGSEPADARMEDLYLWMFPEQGKEEVR